MSTTERGLETGGKSADPIDELFDDDDFEAAFAAAIDRAEIDLTMTGIARPEVDDDDADVHGDEHADVHGSNGNGVAHDVGSNGAAGAVADESDEPDDSVVATDQASVLVADVPDARADAAPAVMPVIVPATTDEPSTDESVEASADEAAVVEARDDTWVGDPVSDDILEELRRADIDGPVVDAEPQDDTAAAKRRPRRSADYDPAPVPIPVKVPRVLGRKPRVRRVTRVVRHVDPWSVFKIAAVANLVLYVTVLTASVLLWNVAHATGTVGNVERFFESFGWDQFEFKGGEIYHAAWIAGLFVVVGLTGLAVLLATLFNLITDLVGGVRLTVLEEEVVETRVSPMRRFVIRRPEPEIPASFHDQTGAVVREAAVDDSGAIERGTR